MADEEGQVVTETITVTQHWLGMEPYTLIKLGPSSHDPEQPALHVEFGGGADNGLMMPLLVVSEHAPEGHPVAEMLRRLAGSESDGYYDQAIADVTREFNEDWLAFVFPDS
jgi:hypothetical protein